MYELKRDGAKALAHVKLVNSDFCLNCYWRDLQGRGNFSYSDEQVCRPNPTLTLQRWAALTLQKVGYPHPTATSRRAAPAALGPSSDTTYWRGAKADRTDGLLEATPSRRL